MGRSAENRPAHRTCVLRCVLNMAENVEGQIERSLGRVEAALQGLKQWGETHQGTDDRGFAEIRQSFAQQDRRLAALEGLADTVESQGQALAEVESRVTQSEKRETVRSTKYDRDRAWLRWIFALVLPLVIDHFTGSKLSAWVGSILK
jgi:hypothetical protein